MPSLKIFGILLAVMALALWAAPEAGAALPRDPDNPVIEVSDCDTGAQTCHPLTIAGHESYDSITIKSATTGYLSSTTNPYSFLNASRDPDADGNHPNYFHGIVLDPEAVLSVGNLTVTIDCNNPITNAWGGNYAVCGPPATANSSPYGGDYEAFFILGRKGELIITESALFQNEMVFNFGAGTYDNSASAVIDLGKLTVAEEAELTFKNSKPAGSGNNSSFTLILNLGELSLGEKATATFKDVASFGSSIGKITLAESAALTLDNVTGIGKIGALTFNPKSALDLLNGSFITTPVGSGGATTLPLETLTIIGDGREPATFTASNNFSSSGDGRALFADKINVVLLDTGLYTDSSVLLHIDNSAITDSNGLKLSGLDLGVLTADEGKTISETRSARQQNFFDNVTVTIKNAGGQASMLQNIPEVGTIITVADKMAESLFCGTDCAKNTAGKTFAISGQNPYFEYHFQEIGFKTWLEASDSSWKLSVVSFSDPEGGGGDPGPGPIVIDSTENSAPLLSGMATNAVALRHGGDLLTGAGIYNALTVTSPGYGGQAPAAGGGIGPDGFGLFTAIEAYSLKISTTNGYSETIDGGSHIDTRGFGFVGGPAYNYETPAGSLLFGAFLEGGQSSYDSDTRIKVRHEGPSYQIDGNPSGVVYEGQVIGSRSVKGDGRNDYFGLGFLLRHDFVPGYYTEASIRTGRLNNSFSSPDMGAGAGYEASFNYLGLHGGLGYRHEYKPGLMMDVYGKLFWDRIGGDSVTTDDGLARVEFEEAEFLRSRLGLRYSAPLLDNLGLNFGGAWDYSFSKLGGRDYGASRGTISSTSALSPAPIAPGGEPSLKGSSGLLELGLDWQPAASLPLTLGLSGNYYLGQVQGGAGVLMLKYVFDGPEPSSPPSGRKSVSPPSAGEAAAWSSPGSRALGLLGPAAAAQAALGRVGEALEEDGERAEVALETVTVYTEPQWKQILSPGAVSVVVPDDYKGEQKSMGELLDIVPGLHINKRGGSGQYTTVNVRGSTAAQVAVYVDGVPQNLGGDAAVDLSLFTAENVARVEVYKGYIPVRFTGAPIGGVINIVTKKPAEASTTVSAGARSYGGLSANGLFTGPLLNGALLLSATRDQSDGDFKYHFWQAQNAHFPDDGSPRTRDRRRLNNSHEKTDLMAKWQNEHFSIQGSWKEMDRYYPWSTTYANYVDMYDGGWNVNRRNNQLVIDRDLTVGYRNDWGDLNWGLELDYKNQSKWFRFEDGPPIGNQGIIPAPGTLWNNYDTERQGATLDAAYKLGEINMLEFRGSLAKETFELEGSDWIAPWAVGSPGARDVFGLAAKYEAQRTSLQLQDTITMDDNLWLTLIMRADRLEYEGLPDRVKDVSQVVDIGGMTDDDGKWNTTFGVALKHKVNDNWTVKTTGGTFIRYPNFYELFGDGVYVRPVYAYAINIPLPQPEKGEQWDVTAEWNGEIPWLETPGNFSVSYFTRRTENMIGLFQTPLYVYYGNYGKTRAYGVELEGGLKSTYADFNFSATWLDARFLDLVRPIYMGSGAFKTLSEGERLLNSPEWETNLRGDFRLPWVEGLTLFAEHHYTGEVPIAAFISEGMRYEEELHQVNLGFRAEILDGLLLTAGVKDVFNQAIRQGFYDTATHGPVTAGETSNLAFPKEGRVFYTTLQYTF